MSTADTSTHARGDFRERLMRIDRGQTICGDDGLVPSAVARKFARKRRGHGRGVIGVVLYPVLIIFAALLGVVSVLAGRLARFHLVGADNPELNVDLLLAMDLGAALVVAFVLRMVFSLDGKLQTLAKLVGIMTAVTSLHNAVHLYPDMARIAFSEQYVAQVQQNTAPNTVIFRGMVIGF